MEKIMNQPLTTDWTDITTALSLGNDTKWRFQNTGGDVLVLFESATEPQRGYVGFKYAPLQPDKMETITQGTDKWWARALKTKTIITLGSAD
jgi:hypothetical protein